MGLRLFEWYMARGISWLYSGVVKKSFDTKGIGFGPLGEGYVRFALIENNHRTRQAIHGIKKFLREG